MQKRQIEIPGTDTELSLACDDFAQIRDSYIRKQKELKGDKDALDCANERVAKMMIKIGMRSCRHLGLTFNVREPKEVKPKVIVKEER